MKQVTKDQFFTCLMAEKRDVIHGEVTHHETSKYYPFTTDMKFRHLGGLFGKIKDFGYVNGSPFSEYFINQ